MRHLLPTLLVSLVISVVVTPLVRVAAIRLRLLDKVTDSRKVHTRPIPRLGGVAIVLGFYGSLGAALLYGPFRLAAADHAGTLVGFALAGGVMATVGFLDDVRGVSPAVKLGAQLAVAAILWAFRFRLDTLPGFREGGVALGALSLPATLLWVAGMANAVNLMDGLDGLAGGIVLVGAVVGFELGAHTGDLLTAAAALALAGGVLGFLFYNVKPASIFMGDTGSLFLGTMLAALAISPRAESRNSVFVLAMAVALGIPIADTALAITRRALRGVPIFSADREHLHHRLVDRGLSHRAAVALLWGASALLAGTGVYLASGGARYTAALSIVLGGGTLLLIRRLGCAGTSGRPLHDRRRENRARLRTIGAISRRLRRSRTVAQLAQDLRGAADALGADVVRLYSAPAPRRRTERPSASDVPELRRRFAIDPRRPEEATLEIAWRDGRSRLDRDVEVAIEKLCRAVAVALREVERDMVASELLARRLRDHAGGGGERPPRAP